MKLEDRIYHIQTPEFCEEIVKSESLEDVCEGDCQWCRAHYTVKALNKHLHALHILGVPFDNGIRVKLPKDVFDELMLNCLSLKSDEPKCQP